MRGDPKRSRAVACPAQGLDALECERGAEREVQRTSHFTPSSPSKSNPCFVSAQPAGGLRGRTAGTSCVPGLAGGFGIHRWQRGRGAGGIIRLAALLGDSEARSEAERLAGWGQKGRQAGSGVEVRKLTKEHPRGEAEVSEVLARRAAGEQNIDALRNRGEIAAGRDTWLLVDNVSAAGHPGGRLAGRSRKSKLGSHGSL